MVIFLAVILILSPILLLVWSNKKSQKNENKNMNNAVYVDSNGVWSCPECDYKNFNGRICKSCGYEVTEFEKQLPTTPPVEEPVYMDVWYCPKCNYKNRNGHICKSCGYAEKVSIKSEHITKYSAAELGVLSKTEPHTATGLTLEEITSNYNDTSNYLTIGLPDQSYLLVNDTDDSEVVHFTLSSRSQEYQDNLLDIEVGQKLTIGNDYDSDKIYFLADGYAIGYAPPKYEELIYGLHYYYSKVEKVTETDSGNISVKVLFRYE